MYDYTFTDYSPHWPPAFEREAARLREWIGSDLLAVHHIGSTSVPGLGAKPIIDMLPVVGEIGAMDRHAARLEAGGYRAWGEFGLPGRRYFTRERGGRRTHHVHAYQHDHPDVERHLAFAAYLRTHDDARREYEALKRQVYARHPADIDAYCDGKDAWIKRTELVAMAWFRGLRE